MENGSSNNGIRAVKALQPVFNIDFCEEQCLTRRAIFEEEQCLTRGAMSEEERCLKRSNIWRGEISEEERCLKRSYVWRGAMSEEERCLNKSGFWRGAMSEKERCLKRRGFWRGAMSEEERCLKRSDIRRQERWVKMPGEQRCLDRRAMPRERSDTLMHGSNPWCETQCFCQKAMADAGSDAGCRKGIDRERNLMTISSRVSQVVTIFKLASNYLVKIDDECEK